MSVHMSQGHKMVKRSQDDDKRLCLVDDLKEVQVHIQVKPIRTSSSLKSKITMPCSQEDVKKIKKCGCYFQGLYYQVPSQDLERGLVRASDDRSLSYMFDVEEIFGRLNLYLDHLDMDLSEYLSQAITYDMDVCVSKTTGPPKKRYCNDFTVHEMVDWAEMEVQNQEGVETSTRNIDKGIDATDGVEAKTCTIDKGKEKVSEDAIESDKSVDYLSPGEKELIQLRNRIKANREAKVKAKDNPILEMSEPNNENSMPAENVRDPFISIEKHMERYPMYDETTHWRLRKPKVGEKYVSVAQFKECLTYYAFENGFSLWYERSGEVRVVAKCGQRPARLFDPEKGKQRKQTKYPSASSDDLPTCPYRCYARVNLDIRLCDIANLVIRKYKCKASPNQYTNAKKYSLIEFEKTVGEHYAMLRSYGKAILDSNPGSTVKLGVIVNPDGKTYFDRFYVCFAGLADGWKARCRIIIALDGCFLKRPNQGEILTAIGRDGNNHIYPVAWAVGLIEAVKDFMPNAEHRQCARNIYENFRKQYPGLEFRQLFWAASKASYH
ncbi:hypothetical protein Tco_1475067 [Tanacetum coccineum]